MLPSSLECYSLASYLICSSPMPQATTWDTAHTAQPDQVGTNIEDRVISAQSIVGKANGETTCNTVRLSRPFHALLWDFIPSCHHSHDSWAQTGLPSSARWLQCIPGPGSLLFPAPSGPPCWAVTQRVEHVSRTPGPRNVVYFSGGGVIMS